MILAGVCASALGALVVVGMTPLVRALALRRGWLDLPDDRKRHGRLVPRLGGVAIAAGVAAGGLLLVLAGARPSSDLWALFGGAGVLWAVGLVDDLYGVGFKRKFFCQLLAAYGLLLTGWRLDLAPIPVLGELDLYEQALLAVPLSLVWLIGVVNAVNLTDGHDGLAVGVGVVSFVAFGLLALAQHQNELAAFCLIASVVLMAFLVYNWAPASIFMGDSGSLLVGFLLAGVSLRVADAADSPIALLAPVVVLGLPLLDTVACMTRRVLARRSPFAPDADHIHHRVVRAAASVRLGVLALYVVAGAYALLGVTVGVAAPPLALTALGLGVVLSYLLLRRLSYVRVRVVLRRLQRRWRRHKRLVRNGERLPLHRTLFVPPPSVRPLPPTAQDDGLESPVPEDADVAVT